MTDELYNKIDKFCNKTDWSKYPTYEHALEDFIKGIVAEETKELEKENAELKGLKDVATLIRANNDTVVTLMQLNNKLVSKSQQLTKAKELLKRYVPYRQITDSKAYKDLAEEAEQFLNSEVEK